MTAPGEPSAAAPRNPARPPAPAARPLVPGLCSVSFRQLDVPALLALVAGTGLAAVEWGGDIHVPVGDLAAAETARELTAKAGLEVSSYGSYFRAGAEEDFRPVAASAAELGAPAIRVWAGRKGSAEYSPEERAAAADALARAADLAEERGVSVGLEYHPNTLTDTLESTLRLLAEVDARRPGATHPLDSYWQPRNGITPEAAVAELRALGGRLTTVHVFSWTETGERLPMSGRSELWRPVFGHLTGAGLGHYALMEFVAGDEPSQLVQDAAQFTAWLEEAEEAEGAGEAGAPR